jgi:hypothetical protein
LAGCQSYALNITNYDPVVNNRFSSLIVAQDPNSTNSGHYVDSPPPVSVPNTDPKFVGLGFDWTGIGGSNYGQYVDSRAYFTPQHYIYANHAGGFTGLGTAGVNDPTVVYIGDLKTHETTPYGYGGDLSMGTSRTPIPVSRGVARYAVLDYNGSSTTDGGANYTGLQVFVTGRTGQTPVMVSTKFQANSSYFGTIFTTPTTQALFEGGDSGQPAFHGWTNPNGDKELTLLGCNYGFTPTNLYLHFVGNKLVIDQLNLLANDEGYAVRCVGGLALYTVSGPKLFNISWVGNGAVSNPLDINQNSNWTYNTVGSPINPSDRFVLFDAGRTTAPHTPNVPAAVTLRGLYFKSTAATGDGFNVGGVGPLTIGRGGVTNYDADTETISVPVVLGNPQVWSIDRGTVAVTSTVDNGGYLLEKTGAGAMTISDVISGTGGLAVSNGLLQLDATQTYTGKTWAHDGNLRVNGSIASSPSLITASGGIVSGHGIVGPITGPGSVQPGDDVTPGILTAPSVYDSDGGSYAFRFTQSGSPTYGIAAASGNDVLRLTAASPFLGYLNKVLSIINRVDLYFDSLPVNSVFRGGFLTDKNSPYSFTDANYHYYVADGAGSVIHNGKTYSEYSGSLTMQLEVVPETADFGSGPVSGYVMQLRALAQPAPGGTALFITPITSTGVLQNSSGSWVLKGANGTATGISGVELTGGSSLIQDESVVQVPHRLNDGAALTLGGGSYELKGFAGVLTTQSFGALTISDGAGTVKLTPGASVTVNSVTTPGTAAVQFASFARQTGGFVNFTATTGLSSTNAIKFTAAPTLLDGLIPYARFNNNDFASYDATNGVIAATYQGTTLAGITASTDNIRIAANETLAANATLNSLVVAPPGAYGSGANLGGKTLTVTSGQVLLATDQVNVSSGTLAFGAAEGHIYGASRNFLGCSITGTGGVTYGGSISLLGMNVNYTGPTRLHGAISLGLGANNVFPDTGAVIIGGDGSLGADSRQTGGETFGSLSGSGTINIGSTLTLTAGGNNTSTTFSGAMDGAFKYTKAGTGTFTYAGIGTTTGNLTVSGGTMLVNGSLANAPASVANTATLGGSGVVGTVTVQTGGRLAPGAGAPGALRTGAQIWSGGSVYQWEISSLTGGKGTTPGWDWLNINGTLDLTATTSNFVLNLDSLGALSGWNSHAAQSWTIATASGGITGFAANKFTINTATFVDENPTDGGTFSVAVSGNDLKLVYTPLYTPVQAWRISNGLPVNGSGTGADTYDASGNGVPNLLKYALGIPATSTSLANLPVVSAAANRLSIVFKRDPLLIDINYIVEASSDLTGAWTPIASSVGGGATTNLGGAASVGEVGGSPQCTVTVQDGASLDSTPRRFLRLKIVRP